MVALKRIHGKIEWHGIIEKMQPHSLGFDER